MRVFCVTEISGGETLICESLNAFVELLADDEHLTGEYKLVIKEMSKEEIEALPEFQGF